MCGLHWKIEGTVTFFMKSETVFSCQVGSLKDREKERLREKRFRWVASISL